MTNKNKRTIGAMSIGMVAGASISMLGSYMLGHKSSVKKSAKKATKFLSNVIDNIEGMM